MGPRRGLLLVGLPIAAGALLLVVALASRPVAPVSAPRAAVKPAARAAAPNPPTSVTPSRPAPPEVAVAAANDARLRGTYQNYRTAVAMGNRPIQEALSKVLRRDREAAERLAREELVRAQTPRDREMAIRMLEILGN